MKKIRRQLGAVGGTITVRKGGVVVMDARITRTLPAPGGLCAPAAEPSPPCWRGT